MMPVELNIHTNLCDQFCYLDEVTSILKRNQIVKR